MTGYPEAAARLSGSRRHPRPYACRTPSASGRRRPDLAAVAAITERDRLGRPGGAPSLPARICEPGRSTAGNATCAGEDQRRRGTRTGCSAPPGCDELAIDPQRIVGWAPRQGTDQIRRSAGECGRIPCGATERRGPHAKMILSLAVSCRGGRAGRVDVAGPRSGSQLGRENRARRSPTSAGSRTARTVPAGPAPASEPFMLMEPQLVETRGYRRQFLPFSSACLINGRVVTCSCWSRSAVLI